MLKEEDRFMKYGFTALNKKGIQQGLKQGLEQGKQEGLEQGKQEGLQQGKYEIVVKMLANGLNTKTISSYTGLSEKDIKNIKYKPKNGSSS